MAFTRASLPVRTARLLQRSRTQTPSEAGAGEGASSPAPAPASLLQDVVDIKTLLLQLKRVLQENETLDPLVGACAESARGNGRPPPAPAPAALHPDACADLRRQILYLQSQLEERDRLVKVLQQQMARLGAPDPPALAHRATADDTCNVATQTDRLRPPTLTTSENSGLVSWNEQPNGRKLAVYSEAQKTRRSVTNGTIPLKCQCGARKVNGLTNGGDPALQRAGAHVGTKYLQALANNTDAHYFKRETGTSEKSPRKLLYCTRSRSIDNFQNQGVSTPNGSHVNLNKATVLEETHVRHHTSYGDIFNGRVDSRENMDGSRHSPASQNGQSTDTDYSSDGGYKSLPSTISCNGSPTKKASGIPRRSVETKLLISKHNFKTSAV
ncbi:hypothetical protein EVAR_84948_1 [Eumeta japonica]|uniref:Uncharacterized protein n=1 Tax=Eumeta variegata TaxID=151549 RepID=A0A4C1VHL0_EUMVA|nr:hypothetical protein EVAR_84948_1 [Eumeta japonica]